MVRQGLRGDGVCRGEASSRCCVGDPPHGPRALPVAPRGSGSGGCWVGGWSGAHVMGQVVRHSLELSFLPVFYLD